MNWAETTGNTQRVQHIQTFSVIHIEFELDHVEFADAVAGLGDSLKHSSWINSACFSTNGHWIATSSSDMTARVWRAQDGTAQTQPMAHGGEVLSVQFSPDDCWIVTASKDGLATVWEVDTGQITGAPLEHDDEVLYAEFSPDGARILTVSRSAARVWDARSRLPVGDAMRHSDQPDPDDPSQKRWWQGGAVLEAHFSPDSSRVATASKDGAARIWEAATGRPLTGPLRHNFRGVVSPTVMSVRFSPDSQRIVTASYDRTARIWDAQSGRLVCEPSSTSIP